MKCPRCEIGNSIQVVLKKTNRPATLCDSCDRLWFEGELIEFNTGHDRQSYSGGIDIEYTLDEFSETDQEHQPADYKEFR